MKRVEGDSCGIEDECPEGLWCDGMVCQENCVSNDHQDCDGGHPYQYDSCGNQGERIAVCDEWQVCVNSGETTGCECAPNYICGDFVIRGLDDLALLDSITTVTGSLTIDSADITEISLPNLEAIGGGFGRECHGCAPNITTIALPNLTTVGGDWGIGGDTPDFNSLALPELEHVGGDFDLVGVEVGILMLPSLDHVSGDFNLIGPFAVNAPRLRSVGAYLGLNDHPSVSLPALDSVGGSLAVFDVSQPIIDFPELRTVGGALSFWLNGFLVDFELMALESVGAGITFDSSPNLPSCLVDELVEQLTDFTGAVTKYELDDDAVCDAPLGIDCVTARQCLSGNCSNDHCAPDGFAYIPQGTFCMGSPGGGGSTECPDGIGEPGRDSDEGPLHEVTLTRGFFLQETEVTQRQWTALGFTNPSLFDECGLDCPVEMVNWWEAVAYVNALSVSEGLKPCYALEGCDPSGAGTDIDCSGITVSDPDASGNPYLCEGYRLPMEAEWEYAYRAETTTAFYTGGITNTGRSPLDENLDVIGWYGGNSGVSYSPGYTCTDWYDGSTFCGTHEVGGKDANGWGLYDMSGNVWEWVWDEYQSDYYSSSADEDPQGGTGSNRVGRGGSWNIYAQGCRAADRSNFAPGGRYSLGFRASRSIP